MPMKKINQQLIFVLDAAPIGVIFVDNTGQIILVNQFVENLFGYDRRELIGTQLNILLPERLRSHHERFVGEFFKNPQIRSMGQDRDLVARHNDGTEFMIEIGLAWIEVEAENVAMAFIRSLSTQEQMKIDYQASFMAHHMQSLDTLATYRSTSVTATAYGMLSLKQSAPQIYDDLVEQYALLLDQALEQKAMRINYDLSTELRDIADQLGYLRSGPRDVIELHASALRSRVKNAPMQKSQAYVDEGNLIALELMGYLVSYYRTSPM